MLLHHPYDSFTAVLDFLRRAADDPQVLAIKMTLYRAGSNSEAVRALMHAAENGKQVAVSIELKARFDEENNIAWARTLERAGAHVFFGHAASKTHAKVALVVRQESDGLRRYVHLSTGNYNAAHGARLHRRRPAHRQPRDRRGRLRAVQLAVGVLEEAALPQAGGRAARR